MHIKLIRFKRFVDPLASVESLKNQSNNHSILKSMRMNAFLYAGAKRFQSNHVRSDSNECFYKCGFNSNIGFVSTILPYNESYVNVFSL
jgi:hypothetical protein